MWVEFLFDCNVDDVLLELLVHFPRDLDSREEVSKKSVEDVEVDLSYLRVVEISQRSEEKTLLAQTRLVSLKTTSYYQN